MDQKAFQISEWDNVATALCDIVPGMVQILGDAPNRTIQAITDIPKGHKLALTKIAPNEEILKYGVRIGKAVTSIASGEWVHLHNIRSVYDERSSHLDVVTGAPTDIRYE